MSINAYLCNIDMKRSIIPCLTLWFCHAGDDSRPQTAVGAICGFCVFVDFVMYRGLRCGGEEGKEACGALGPLDVGAYPAALPPAGLLPLLSIHSPLFPFSWSGQ